MTRNEIYIHAVKTFNRWLEQHRLRKTPERFAILKQAWQFDRHFRVDELHAALENSRYHVSRATVYNTVALLEECGVVRRHQLTGEATYELATGNHLHLICTRCGRIQEQEATAEVAALLAPGRYTGFTPRYLTAYVYGLCGECAAKSAETTER